MPYQCPRCGKEVSTRWLKPTELGGGPSVGLFYPFYAWYFRGYHCPEHGRIAEEEFTLAVRRQITHAAWTLSVAWAIALVVVGGLICYWLWP